MRETEMMTTAMIVMEPGSDWPAHIEHFTNLVAFSQGCDDPLRATQEKLGVLHRSRQTVDVAVLACNAATDIATAGRRAQLARTLLGAVALAACGRLVLSASGHTPHRLLQELLALTDALAGEKTTATVTLQLAGT
jgi:ABC-type transporter Mla subunit MlaD